METGRSTQIQRQGRQVTTSSSSSLLSEHLDCAWGPHSSSPPGDPSFPRCTVCLEDTGPELASTQTAVAQAQTSLREHSMN